MHSACKCRRPEGLLVPTGALLCWYSGAGLRVSQAQAAMQLKPPQAMPAPPPAAPSGGAGAAHSAWCVLGHARWRQEAAHQRMPAWQEQLAAAQQAQRCKSRVCCEKEQSGTAPSPLSAATGAWSTQRTAQPRCPPGSPRSGLIGAAETVPQRWSPTPSPRWSRLLRADKGPPSRTSHSSMMSFRCSPASRQRVLNLLPSITAACARRAPNRCARNQV